MSGQPCRPSLASRPAPMRCANCSSVGCGGARAESGSGGYRRLRLMVADMNEAVLRAIEEHALTPEAVEAAVIAMQGDVSAKVARSLEREVKALDEKIDRLTDAIAKGGGAVSSLVAKLKELDAKRSNLVEEIAGQRPVPMPPRDVVEDRLAEWRRHLRASVATGRAVLDRLLPDRIVFRPILSRDAKAKPVAYEFECPTRYDRLFSGLVVPPSLFAKVPGAEHLGPDDVYYRAEDSGVDFGEVLRRAMVNRTRVASPTGAVPEWTRDIPGEVPAAGRSGQAA